MRLIHSGVLVLALLIVLSACGEDKPQASARAEGAAGQAASPERAAPAPAADTVQYETVRQLKTAGDCDPAEEGCTHIRLVYPKITRAAAKAALQQGINAGLLRPVFEQGADAAAANSPEALMAQFFALYETTLNDDPASALFGWAVERTIRVVYNTPRVFVIETSDYSFTGGAHPNSMSLYANFDPRQGRKLALDDLFQPGYRERLIRIAEQEFRRARQMGPGDTFESAGFWFDNNQFRLPDNFFISERGLSFFYNPYEIAPYAMGSVEFTLSRAALQSILRPDGPLAE